jgi:hypothetical protein
LDWRNTLVKNGYLPLHVITPNTAGQPTVARRLAHTLNTG